MNASYSRPLREQTVISTNPYADVREAWASAEVVYTDIGAHILGHPVMETWEAPYMEKLAHAACSSVGAERTPARILEVGFGLGISARCIHQQLRARLRAPAAAGEAAAEAAAEGPDVLCEHVVVEANADILISAGAFKEEIEAEHAGHRVTLAAGFWQDVCPAMAAGSFDGIVFDCYPLTWQETVWGECESFFPEAARLLRPGGVFAFYYDVVDSWIASKRAFAEETAPALLRLGFRSVEADEAEVEPTSENYFWKTRFVVPICTR